MELGLDLYDAREERVDDGVLVVVVAGLDPGELLFGRAIELALVRARVARVLRLELGELLVLARFERIDLLGRLSARVLDPLCPVWARARAGEERRGAVGRAGGGRRGSASPGGWALGTGGGGPS